MVFLGVPESIWPVAAVKSDEAMPFPLPEAEGRLSLLAEETIRRRAAGCDAVLLGCGLGRGRQTDVLDEWERRRGRVTVLTPHEGEFLRVGGNLSQGRTAAAEDFARRSGAVVVLKGPGTVVAGPDGRCRVNATGNCGMAKGGSGDVLSGVVLALLGLGMDAFDACCCAVWLHGRAGDLAAQEKGQWGMTPTDLLERLPQALREVTE